MSGPRLRDSLGSQLFEFVPDPIFLIDPAGVFLDLNRAAARYLGREAEELVGRSVREVFPPEQAQRQQDVIDRVVATGEPFAEERVTPLGDRTYIFQYAVRRIEDLQSRVVGVMGMVRDVTNLVQLQAQYQELYEQATDALFAVDPGGRLRALNREAEAMSGYARGELETLHFSQLVPPDEASRLERYFEQRLSGQDAPTQYETQYVHGSGEERWAEVKISRQPSGPGVYQASVRDVTPRKRLEGLRQEFLGMVSHEVKTPLTVIHGFASAMGCGMYGKLSSEQSDCLERIVGASRRVRDLIEQFLLAEHVDGERGWTDEPGPVATVLSQAIENFRGEALSRQVELHLDVELVRDLWITNVTAVRQVVDNLLANALKFTSAGGSIRVQTGADSGAVLLEVRDTGVGIPAAELDRIFERFFRASNSRGAEGSGLGLYIVRGIVEKLGGTIQVESRPGEDTCFRVRIPLAE